MRTVKQVVKLTLEEYNFLIDYADKNKTSISEALRHGALSLFYATEARESEARPAPPPPGRAQKPPNG